VLQVRLLHPERRRLLITFSDHLAFRKAGERYALVTLDTITATSLAGRSFYLAEESDYVRWFVEQGDGIQRAESLIHMTIVTTDAVIDVISRSGPAVGAA
jgi:hypothetical protein